MTITSLRLIHFRNYETLSLEPGDGVTLFLGDNAQGKTNLLEAVALLSTGRSHRTRSDRDMILLGETEAALRARVRHTYAEHELDMRLHTNERRLVTINGAKTTRTGELLGHITAVLFAPEDLSLIKEGPGERRRFMDMQLSQAAPAYYYALQRYTRAVKQRNALLRSGKCSAAELDIWDEQLCEAAPQIIERRRAFALRLADIAGARHRDIGGEELSVAYHPAADAQTMPSLLAQKREEDMRRGSTSVGPHRDDLILRIDGRDSRLFASQGQQRTAALSLKLSQMQWLREQTGEWPILLLDDVMSELDERRQRALIEHMQGVQTFVTAATGSPIMKAARVYRVSAGTLS